MKSPANRAIVHFEAQCSRNTGRYSSKGNKPGKEYPMSDLPVSQPEPGKERDAKMIAYFATLVHARRENDYLEAAEAHRSLKQLGVQVRFPRPQKGVDLD
jgi:hypothetical protein